MHCVYTASTVAEYIDEGSEVQARIDRWLGRPAP